MIVENDERTVQKKKRTRRLNKKEMQETEQPR